MKNLLFILVSAVAGVAVMYFIFKKKEEECKCDKEKERANDVASGERFEMVRAEVGNRIPLAGLLTGTGNTSTPIATEEAQIPFSGDQLATDWD